MPDFSFLEFHRSGFGLLPHPNDREPGTAIQVPALTGTSQPHRSCTCRTSKKKTCPHVLQLSRLISGFGEAHGGRDGGEVFAASWWHRLGQLLHEGGRRPYAELLVAQVEQEGKPSLVASSPDGSELLRYFDHSPPALRLLERIGKAPATGLFADRAGLLQKLSLLLRTSVEQAYNAAGLKSHQQSFEESLWARLAYHAFREYGDRDLSLHPAIEEHSGDFTLTCRPRATGAPEPLFRLVVPRRQVRSILDLLAREFPGEPHLAIHPIPLKSLFMVSPATEMDLEVRPLIQALQASGEARFLESEEVEKFRYGDLVYLREMQVLAELEQPGAARKFRAPAAMKLRRSQVPSFIEAHRREIEEGAIVFADSLGPLRIFEAPDLLEIVPEALERSWYWLSVRYGFGSERVALADLLKAKREGSPYFQTTGGWVDLNSPAFRGLERIVAAERAEQIQMSPASLLRLALSTEGRVRVEGQKEKSIPVERLLALQPAEAFQEVAGLSSSLRAYQRIGVEWMMFLYENGFGGLLCDDMGLGKTHQAMALMLWLRERRGVKEPFLVVCPTSVITHWRDKIRDHAPGLKAAVHHGLARDVKESAGQADVLVTSYGILRNDLAELREIPFGLAVFDEIQNLKNRDTLAYQAAAAIGARVKVGLTGTPVENSLEELIALVDLVLPGYLGEEGHVQADALRAQELRRITSPFVLRRLKRAVLHELPEKIEDVRTCILSEDQVRLYREAVATRGKALAEALRAAREPVPYLHVFALLNLLKQICDHPALALGKLEDHARYASGKWELFQELLYESLDSGQKVVVFTQYLGMIAMMSRLLQDLGIDFVTLTGSTRERGEVIRRFNEAPDCRVFLGSLKAGGAGIDLVAASVVLHYDRWWNAAREDQATDRVYRIGQKRAVQVFKLVTEGTLEEKIAGIIEKKRRLMNAAVQVDDPHLAKIFTREELIDMLRPV